MGRASIETRLSVPCDLFNPIVRDTEDDDTSIQRNHTELTKELRRDKPWKEIILSLL